MQTEKHKAHGFFKMDEATITTMQQELANDIYELAARHREGITQLLEEFNGQQIATTVELDAYEKEWRQHTGEKDDTDEESDHTVPVTQNKDQGTDKEAVDSRPWPE